MGRNFLSKWIYGKIQGAGEVAEWLKAHAWKACNGATRSQVRILFSPPGFKGDPTGGLFFAQKNEAFAEGTYCAVRMLRYPDAIKRMQICQQSDRVSKHEVNVFITRLVSYVKINIRNK